MHDFKTRIALVNMINEVGLSTVLHEFADLVEGQNDVDPNSGQQLRWLHEILRLAAGFTKHSKFTIWISQSRQRSDVL